MFKCACVNMYENTYIDILDPIMKRKTNHRRQHTHNDAIHSTHISFQTNNTFMPKEQVLCFLFSIKNILSLRSKPMKNKLLKFQAGKITVAEVPGLVLHTQEKQGCCYW